MNLLGSDSNARSPDLNFFNTHLKSRCSDLNDRSGDLNGFNPELKQFKSTLNPFSRNLNPRTSEHQKFSFALNQFNAKERSSSRALTRFYSTSTSFPSLPKRLR